MEASTPRRLRAFKRWMRAHGIVCSDALHLAAGHRDSVGGGVSVRALGALRVGDLVATIPRSACLTPRTSGAADAIAAAGLGGCLALAVAVMYESALGAASPWDAYLRLLPDCEPLPLVWGAPEAARLLAGTELEKIVKQDRRFLHEDWKECIEPLISSGELRVDPDYFSLENFLSAKTLVSSRSFEIDSYHGSGMLKYPAPGAPDLARRTKELIEQAGFGPVEEDRGRGLDHGAWVPLMLMYPDASIPVCQLSVQTERDGTYHYNLGKALAALRDEGVLIVGSGNATHNLRKMGPDGSPILPWALEFDTWLKESLLNGRYDDVNHYEEKAPHAKSAHPWPDHFYPLHVALGAAGDAAKAELIHHSWTNASISYASYRFSTKN